MQICNDATNGCMYCMCIHMYPSCLNIINQFDGYRSSSIRKQQKIALFCQNQKESEESTKKAKTFMFVALFCWPRKAHTHRAMIISWKATPILWVSLYLHCNSIIYWHFFVFDLHFSLYCNIRVLASFFLIDFCGQVFPQDHGRASRPSCVHFPRFW